MNCTEKLLEPTIYFNLYKRDLPNIPNIEALGIMVSKKYHVTSMGSLLPGIFFIKWYLLGFMLISLSNVSNLFQNGNFSIFRLFLCVCVCVCGGGGGGGVGL